MKLLEKLISPRNNWDMKSTESWWPMLGSMPTVTGKRVSEDSALRFSAVCAATRIISETLASLPLNTLQQVDSRTTNKATDHPLYKLLHDIPNPEQDSMTFFDQQTAFTVNWGNSYAEIQRGFDNEIIALWPIHPSRIPCCNITRNPQVGYRGWTETEVGEPGELVYWVKNDDGTVTPIPKSDVLHVPGVLSTNGITGQSVVQLAANSIGIGLATEEHAGALFKNGAVTNMVIKSLKAVGKETAERLRQQWQQTFGSVGNHYKTLLLEDGMEPVPVSMNAEETQLILSRQFSVTEIARWYRLPPHLLADLSRSTFANIEAENLSFVVHSMLPWIVRWEKALYRQLLTPAEQNEYRFKFNVNGLLRGDTAARAQFYQVMFNLGAFSPNDIRAREDENPIEGGDQYFVQGNNAVPLDKVGELADAQIEKANAPAPAPKTPDPNAENHARLIELRKLNEELIARVELRDADDALREQVSSGLAEIARRQDEAARVTDERLQSLSTTISEQPEKIHVFLASEVAKITENTPKIDDFARFVTTTLDTTMQPVRETVDSLLQRIDATAKDIREHGDAERDATVEMIVKQAESIRDSVAEQVAPITEKLDSVPELVTQAVDALAKQAAEARDTSESDEIAEKRAEIERLSAEMEEKHRLQREATDRLLAFSLQRGIERMAGREANAIAGAREEPRGFTEWRTGFYKTFLRLFEHELDGFVSEFEVCGVVIDPKWGADRYVGASITDLKTLDDTAQDNHYDRLKAATDNFVKVIWTDRAKTLTDELISRGRRLFDEKKEQKCTN